MVHLPGNACRLRHLWRFRAAPFLQNRPSAYLILVMGDGKWRVGKLLLLGVVILPLVAFGKETFAILSYGGAPEKVEQTYATLVTAGMRTSTMSESRSPSRLERFP